MANLSTQVKKYASNNGVASVDFTKDVLLQDDSNGQGPYIKTWNLAIAQPSAADLSAVDSDANAMEALAAVLSARKTAYGDIGSQLDMQYHDNVDGTTTWKDHVAKVKADHPKP